MSRFWSPIVRELAPYVPGEQPKFKDVIKLNTNENPYGPSPKVLEAIRAEAGDALRLYPDPNSDRLREAIARRFDLVPAQVFVGNGSDEVLAHTFHALLNHPQPLLFPDITYSFYQTYCRLYGVRFETIPLTEDFAIRVDDYLRPNGGIIFPNPNAPTGRPLALAEIARLLRANGDSVVVIDEAYIDFGGETAAPLVASHPNLLVVQTFSKSRSLAGLRVGFALGHPELIEALDRIKNSFNSYPLDRFAIVGGAAAIEDDAWFEKTRGAVMETRAWLTASLAELGFDVLPSAANFVFARHSRLTGEWLTSQLRERHIFVRHFRQPRIESFLRITVGTPEQCEALIMALRELIG